MANRRTEKNVNAIVEEILDEDQDDDFNVTRSETCPGRCNRPDNIPQEAARRCKCAVENSSRFSLRVMEAMRSLQRDVEQPSTSTAEDIVDYIRTNYRSNGDLYAQVRTALRQVCSQGFVMELLDNEYHLIGPFVSTMRQTAGCSYDCKNRASLAIDDTARRGRIDNRRDSERFPRRYGPPRRHPRSPREEPARTPIVDSPEDFAAEATLHSPRRADSERDNADYRNEEFEPEELSPDCDCEGAARDDRRQRDGAAERRDRYAIRVTGPSRAPSPTPAKRVRMEDRRVQRADVEEATAEEDCVCDADAIDVTRNAHSRSLPRTPRVVTGNQRDERGREDAEEDTEEEEAEDTEGEDEEDSAYRELRRRPRGRSKARDRELKRWIRRCRRECERKGAKERR